MAANDVEAAGKVSDSDDKDRLSVMRRRYTMALSAYSDSREDELDDLRFMAGSPDNQWQWPADVLATRGSVQGQTINARPCLTINKLPQHVRQVTNEQRQNRPTGKVIPADDRADVRVAEIFDGMVRHIEYISDADVAYDTACDNQVTYGEGYIRILTEYAREDSFDQDIKIGRVRNSFSVYMDPAIQDPCGADAGWCFITEDVSKADYERMFPDAAPISSLMSQGVGDQSLSQWLSEDMVRIAEYFYYEHEKATLNLYPDNLSLNLVIPLGPNCTLTIFEWYFASPGTGPGWESMQQGIAFSDQIQQEDIVICEQVQRGLKSSAYTSGRFSALRENGVHHFQSLVREFLASETTPR